jgi:hypothetical protein
MSFLIIGSRRGAIPDFRAGALTLLLIITILLTSCSGSKSSAAVVSQGSPTSTLGKPGNAESAILADLHGTVEVKTGDALWTQAQPGQIVKSGQNIRTGAVSNGTVVFYDGSRMVLGAEAEIALDVLDARTSGARVVQVTQMSGESQHEVAQSDDPGSRYDVNTPAGSGSASSTKFSVLVLPDLLSQFWVESGVVSIVNENVKVEVVAGQTTSVLVGQPPIEPEFRITGEGQMMQIKTAGDGSVLLPAYAPDKQKKQNDKITLCHATGSATNPYVEITVSVAGATHGHAKHPGDIIPAPAEGCPNSTPVTSTTPTSWNIAGQTFLAGASTVVFGNPQPGDWVSFEGRQLSDGSRFADRIMLLSHSLENQFAFIGKVESIGDTAWTISGRVVQVNEFSEIEDGLMVGDTVQVAGSTAEDGSFWAKRLNQTEGVGSNFRFAGIINSMDNNIWTISGIKVTVGESTTLYGDFEEGNPVVAEGVIKEDGTWLATTINLVTPEGYRFEFIGVVQSLSPWIVSGVSFNTADWSEIDADIKVGEKVRVSGMVSADGIWVAESIERLDTEHSTSFAFYGPVISLDPWNVGGVSLVVDDNTIIKGDITLGEMVKVKGAILEDGSWLATEIKHTGLHLGQGCFMFTNVVQSATGDQIVLVDGQTIQRTSDLEVTGDLKEGSLVRYQFCVDKDGVGKIGRITLVSQLEEFAPATTGKVVICHYPPGNPGNRHTIEVGRPALSAHLAHGDTQGLCPSEKLDKKPKKNK